VRRFAIVDTPNELYAELHDRMLVVLAPETWPAWLGEDPPDPRELKPLLAPYPSAGITCWSVSIRVVNVKNNDPSVISPGTKVRGFNLSDRPCHGNGRRERIVGLNTAFIRPQP
jgi:putative SOS response-associated peptidase YedK